MTRPSSVTRRRDSADTCGRFAVVGDDAAAILRRRLAGVGITAGDALDDDTDQLIVVEQPAPAHSYLGVADNARPNVLHCSAESVEYLAALLTEYVAAGACGVRVRRPVEREWATIRSRRKQRARLRRFDPMDYDWDTAEDTDEVFDGVVTLCADGESTDQRIRVAGILNPLDGHSHWVGTAYGEPVLQWRRRKVREVDIRTEAGYRGVARLTDVTPWETVRIVGVGALPC